MRSKLARRCRRQTTRSGGLPLLSGRRQCQRQMQCAEQKLLSRAAFKKADQWESAMRKALILADSSQFNVALTLGIRPPFRLEAFMVETSCRMHLSTAHKVDKH
jgi:hypothetical protein